VKKILSLIGSESQPMKRPTIPSYTLVTGIKCGLKQNFHMYCPLLNEFYLEDPKRKEDLKLGR